MGIYDSMKQMGTPAGIAPQSSGVPNAMGQGFAQQKPVSNMQKPNNNMAFGQAAGNLASAYRGRPNPTLGAGGSNSMLQAKQLALKNQQAQPDGTIGGSYNQLLSSNPQLQSYRDRGMRAGQDMSWMDRPGALQMRPDVVRPDRPQYGLQDVYSRMEAERNPAPVQSPMAVAAEQPDMGSQDPRELARVSGGIGPSPQMMGQQIQMDENGMEPRRGAR